MNRLSDKEAIDLLKHGDILELGQQANKSAKKNILATLLPSL